MGSCELLLDSPDVKGEQQSKIKEVKKAGERAALLTRQLLAFSRKQVLAPQVLDLNSVIENLRKMIERLIGEDIQFVGIPFAPLGVGEVDPGQVDQMTMNLVVDCAGCDASRGKVDD